GLHLDHRVGPGVGVGAAPAVRAPLGCHGYVVGVLPLYEGGCPGPVNVPEEDVHGASRSRLRSSTAATTASGSTVERHGCPSIGQRVARLSRQPASGSPSRTVGTRYGPHCPKGTV